MEKTEVLARAWIECDPNRMGSEVGSGFHPDDTIPDRGTELDGKPRWHWFIPRAEYLERYLNEHGWAIVPNSAAPEQHP